MTTIKEYEQDAPASNRTPYTVEANDTIAGDLSSEHDKDWFKIYLHKGITYEIRLTGLTKGHVTLKDDQGTTIQESNQEINGARLVINPTMSGTYYIEIASEEGENGSYQMTVQQERPVGTYQDIADYLESGYWTWDNVGKSIFDISQDNIITVNLDALDADTAQLAKQAFAAWSNVTNLEFTYVSENENIRIEGNSGRPASTYWRSTGTNLEFIEQAVINIPPSWLEQFGYTTDSYGFTTLLHEIGHALGLGHPGPYDGSANWGTENVFLADSWQASVLSYIEQNENEWLQADLAYPVTPMIADVLAIQSMYGKPDAINGGNTRYGYEANTGGYMEKYFELLTREVDIFTQLIEVLDFKDWRKELVTLKMDFVDLDGDGKEDLVMAGHYELVFFRNTSTGTDPEYSVDKDNDYGINDITIKFVFSAPIFYDMDQDGQPELILVSTNGTDIYKQIQYYERTGETFEENAQDNPFKNIDVPPFSTLAIGDIDGDGFPDVVTGNKTEGIRLYWNTEENGVREFREASPENNPVSNVMIPGGIATPVLVDMDNDGDLDLVSGSRTGRLYYYENTIENGNISFVESRDNKIGLIDVGSYSAPVLTDIDNDGKKEIVIAEQDAVVRWYVNTGTLEEPKFEATSLTRPTTFTITDTGGIDTLDLRTDRTDQVINLEMESASDIYGIRGNMMIGPDTVIERVVAGTGNDVVNGNSANNNLRGNSGNDRLYGKEGDDNLYGSSGNDWLNGGEGADTLEGGAGTDILEGGAGADTLTGDTGSDTASYSGSPAAVTVRLHNDQIEGGDAADDTFPGRVEISWTDSEGTVHTESLPDIENLTGSAFDDTLAGDRRDNHLDGGPGNDTLFGGPGGGDDTMIGGSGNDRLFGGQGNDKLQGGLGNDRLTGGPGQDVFIFAPGTYEDTIADFTLGEDKIDLTAFGLENTDNLVVRDAENTVFLDPGLLGGVTVIFENLTEITISDDHFIV